MDKILKSNCANNTLEHVLFVTENFCYFAQKHDAQINDSQKNHVWSISLQISIGYKSMMFKKNNFKKIMYF